MSRYAGAASLVISGAIITLQSGSFGVSYKSKKTKDEKAGVSQSDAKPVIALPTGACRSDRFCEGALLDLCRNGSVVR